MCVFCRIRERRKLQILESREKRKVEKPRLPRTAKKIQTKKMESELGQLGIEIEPDDDVSIVAVLQNPQSHGCCCFCILLNSLKSHQLVIRHIDPSGCHPQLTVT